MLRRLRADDSNRQEMAYESGWQQPVVAMKRCNDRGAKGHSQ